MRITVRYRRFLTVCIMAIGLFIATGANAQDAGVKLRITFTDGTQSVIVLTEDLRMDFDSQHLLILQSNEDPRILHIQDIAHFTYATGSSGISGITSESEPIITFRADGISISMPGEHKCRVFDLKGTMLVNQGFVDTVSIDSRNFPTGTVILQIDQDKTFKFLVK